MVEATQSSGLAIFQLARRQNRRRVENQPQFGPPTTEPVKESGPRRRHRSVAQARRLVEGTGLASGPVLGPPGFRGGGGTQCAPGYGSRASLQVAEGLSGPGDARLETQAKGMVDSAKGAGTAGVGETHAGDRTQTWRPPVSGERASVAVEASVNQTTTAREVRWVSVWSEVLHRMRR
jgi:hypothetical protein